MPNIRLRQADGLSLIIPAHTVRLIESYPLGFNERFPEAVADILYDLGNGDELQAASLCTMAGAVYEEVRADPKFFGRFVEDIEVAGGRRLWAQPQHLVALAGYRPPSADDIAKGEASVQAVEIRVSELDPADQSPDAAQARQSAAQLRINLQNLKSFIGVQAKLSLTIQHRGGDRHLTYWLTEAADDVIDRFEPPTKPQA